MKEVIVIGLKRVVGICVIVVIALISILLGRVIFAPQSSYAEGNVEYRVISPSFVGASELEGILNRYAQEGWKYEDLWSHPLTHRVFLIFSR